MNYASFIYKMIYLNNSLKHAQKKFMSISDREKNNDNKIKICKYLFKGSNSK